MASDRKTIGQSGEDQAAKYLCRQGYKVIARNYRNQTGRQLGEIDIIARQGKEMVFVEVKTRVSASLDIKPEEVINSHKLHKLNRIAEQYIRIHRLWDQSYRFDAIAVILHPTTNLATIRHLDHIFL